MDKPSTYMYVTSQLGRLSLRSGSGERGLASAGKTKAWLIQNSQTTNHTYIHNHSRMK